MSLTRQSELSQSPGLRNGRTNASSLPLLPLLAATLVGSAILFGGATRSNALRLAVIELAALPVLAMAIETFVRNGLWSRHRSAVSLLIATLAIPLIQLIPLPPSIWAALPGRDSPMLALELIGVQPGWSTLSLTPDNTWVMFLGLLVPAAAFMAVVTLGGSWGRRLAWIILLGCAANVLLAAFQGASGGVRLFYPWSWTPSDTLTGLFANRNHLATFCAATVPLAAVLAMTAHQQSQRSGRARGRRPAVVWVGLLYVGLMVLTLGVVRSRAGILMLPIAMGLGLLAAWIASGRGRPSRALLVLTAAGTAAILALGVFAIVPIMGAFDTGGAPEGRFEDWPTVIQAAQAYLPVGSGLGSFDPVYRSFEPLARLDETYFNQAHNDYLQILLETGWAGAGLLVAFLVWFIRRSWSVWSSSDGGDVDLARGASAAVLLIMLHSGADYPLRTLTISVLFAICCGVLEVAAPPHERHRKRARAAQLLAKGGPAR